MVKYHTVHKCMQCRYHATGRADGKTKFKIIVMCGATGKYFLLTNEMIEYGNYPIPDGCPLHEMNNPLEEVAEVVNCEK